MRQIVLSVLGVLVVGNFLLPEILFAQTALQEILRFDIPVNENFSYYVDAGGDINGDGRPDLIFGCYGGHNVYNASLYVFHSIPDSTLVPDQLITCPTQDSSIIGGFGESIAYAGDLNGDGISDLVVGIQYYGLIHQGAIAIYWGGATLSVEPDVFIDGLPFGYTQSWDLYFGRKVLTSCDVNGDGINDLLVYADGPQLENWGNVYVFLGGYPFSTTPALHIRGNVHYERLGYDMSTGDINGDGFDDIVLTNRVPLSQDNPYLTGTYELKIYAGGQNLSNVPVYDIEVANRDINNGSIAKMIANGDLNGDGFDDIVIQYNDSNGQKHKIIYGQSDFSALTMQDYPLLENWLIGLINFYCNLNNDPYSDLCYYSLRSPGSTVDNGACVVYKQTSAELDLSYDYINSGTYAFNGYGIGYPVGDLNGDGYSELFIYSSEYSIQEYTNFATILTERYVAVQDDVLPAAICKLHCYPNPFNPSTTIRFSIPKKGKTKLIVYNIKGQKVRTLINDDLSFGFHEVVWNGRDDSNRAVSSGVYFARLEHSNQAKTSKMMLMK